LVIQSARHVGTTVIVPYSTGLTTGLRFHLLFGKSDKNGEHTYRGEVGSLKLLTYLGLPFMAGEVVGGFHIIM